MNYDLLKLSKILPTIKGKRILDIYQESLDRARQAQQQIQPEITNSHKYLLRPVGLHISDPETLPSNLKKLGLTKSEKTLPRSNNIQDYGNLNALLQEVHIGEEDEYFEEFSGNGMPPSQKSKVSFGGTSSKGFTPYKEQPSETSQSHQRPVSNSTQSNFVFSKKKKTVTTPSYISNDYDNIHQLYRNEGPRAFNKKQLTLNGKHVDVRGLQSEARLTRPRQIYNLQLDPMTNLSQQHITPNDSHLNGFNGLNGPSTTSNKLQETGLSWKQVFNGQTTSHKKLLFSQKPLAIPEPLNSTKAKGRGLELNGTNLKPLDSKRNQHYRSTSSVKHISGAGLL